MKGETERQWMWFIVVVIGLILLLAMYLLSTQFFVDHIIKNINTDVKLCETMEKIPLFGTSKCSGS